MSGSRLNVSTPLHTHTLSHKLLLLLLLHSEPQIRGDSTTIIENRSPVRVCVDLRGATQSTSQDLTITFTPQSKPSATNQATRKNMKFIILDLYSSHHLITSLTS